MAPPKERRWGQATRRPGQAPPKRDCRTPSYFILELFLKKTMICFKQIITVYVKQTRISATAITRKRCRDGAGGFPHSQTALNENNENNIYNLSSKSRDKCPIDHNKLQFEYEKGNASIWNTP